MQISVQFIFILQNHFMVHGNVFCACTNNYSFDLSVDKNFLGF